MWERVLDLHPSPQDSYDQRRNIYTTATNTDDLKQMQNTIIYYKPAHLGLNVYLGFSWNGKICFDGTYTYGSSITKWEE